MTWLNILKHHRWKLGLLVLAANIGVLLNLAFGTPKAFHEWQWLDIIGEGGTALFVLLWLVLVLKSRPTGRVTNYLSIGLCCIFFSWWMDVLDEFIRLPKHLGWNHWLESGPMPVGMVLLTIGLYHWHREQQAINQQMEKRERIFREHRLFDKLTPLGGADYLKRQVSDCMAQSLEQQQPLSLLALDIDDFASLNQHYGHAEGDAVLQALSQLLLLNLRRHDLLCRLAGDRFVVLLPNTGESQARVLALELQQAVQSLAHKTRQHGERVYLSASTAVVMAFNEAPDELLKRLNLALARAKPVRSKRA
ncbi:MULTISPECIES: GGDEF domain-containing protein [unclassified Pseudomonas]|uniref:GGDEF domain-containing protein n=1 Tax=unclassified Pseudomonas TaxID=196821 RepID=UPI001297FBD0|nr:MULTISPECIES: GGDEF domain-containing protein [unclassified Pseudomonas]MQT43634.1 diguanylate cyclase [Pseudomonas sp. FSL R10-0765]MQT54974.1 diguanylate cyclase [Pseudomonas sp. FSL R10-2398]MQU01338.1 diguanylate cyclase [Pseudomonas sp. FSL R10-2245]MQU14493.1 diguanylate cyclase [Pseudomonas sp. FSL R10-2189]MQU40047.1 diguanylate cyclase [Pseudomonas sp. FSL R10-2172]